MNKYFCGIDLGGTKIHIGIVTKKGKILKDVKIPTKVEAGPKHALQRITASIFDLLQELNLTCEDLEGIGIGSPGPLDTQRGIILKSSNLSGWENTQVIEFLKKDFPTLPIKLENDANAATIGEYLYGVGNKLKDFVYITISTGFGGGAIVNGSFQNGSNSNAFEIGHTILNFNGPKCNCGNRGCIEAYASGTALENFARKALLSGEKSILSTLSNNSEIKCEHIVQAALKKDDLALRLLDDYGYYLGLSLYNVIATYNPQVIAIGGGLSNALDLFYDKIIETIDTMSLKANINACEIKKAQKENCGLLGAAALNFYL